MFNVINDDWLYVRYKTGEVKQVSIRQAFIDADIIECLETPVYHGTPLYLYNIPVIQLFTTILLATYYKPEHDFISSEKSFIYGELKNNGWNISNIIDYLDKYQNKFNVFDDTYPFMQDIKLKTDEVDDTLSYISKISLVAPAGNNVLFEHNTEKSISMETYKLSIDELVYTLLYTRYLGSSPMAAQYPHKSLCGNATLFITCSRETLKQTIIANTLPLENNNDDEYYYDRPVWEFDNIEEIQSFIYENSSSLADNTLFCSFYPAIPIYIVHDDNEIKNVILSRNPKDGLIDKEAREELSRSFVKNNPTAIRTMITSDNDNIIKYKEWTTTTKLIALCMDITKKVDKDYACKLLSSENTDVNAIYTIYYRQYDGMKSNVLSIGQYSVKSNILNILQDETNRSLAEKFQIIYSKMLKCFNIFSSEFSENNLKSIKNIFSTHAENYFFTTFIDNIDKDSLINDILIEFTNYSKSLIKSNNCIINDPIKYAQTYKQFCAMINKICKEESINE